MLKSFVLYVNRTITVVEAFALWFTSCTHLRVVVTLGPNVGERLGKFPLNHQDYAIFTVLRMQGPRFSAASSPSTTRLHRSG